MQKNRFAMAAAAGLVAALAATAAHAYPDPTFGNVGGSAADGVVAPGEEFTLSGDFGGTDCDPWTSTFAGASGASGSGTTFSVTFTAPQEEGTYSVDVTCVWEDPAALSSAGATARTAVLPLAATTTLSFPIEVTTGTGGDDGGEGDGAGGTDGGAGTGADGGEDAESASGVLPGTGGPDALLLVAGGALVAAGAGLVVARRRQAR